MITIIRSRGVLYAQLKQTEKAKIDQVMQLLRELGR